MFLRRRAAHLGDCLELLKQDARALVAARGRAQRAVDHLNLAAGWTRSTPVASPGTEATIRA